MRNGTDVRNASACYRWLRRMAVPVALCGLSAHATQYVVPGGAGDKSGGSWANAREDVQAAVNAATLPGEEVWVAAGRYEVAAPVALRSGSVVLGGFAGTENAASQRNWDANVTILDGLDATRVVSMEDIVSGRLDGLVVTRGYVSVTNGMGGGGILIQGSEGCEVANCKILHNRSVRSTGATACEGGGIYLNYGTNCVIANCLFTENTSVSYGTSLSIRNSSGVTVTTSRFVGCFMDGTLGVVRVQSNTSGIQFFNCLASGNKAQYGSFIYASQDMSAINCTVCCTTNSAGGSFYNYSANIIKNNLIAFNAPVGIWEITTGSDPYVYNNLFYGQTVADYYDHDQSLYQTGAEAVNTSALPDRASGNVDGDPQFVRFPAADDGTWTSVAAYDADRAQTTLTDANAAFRPGALKGLCLNPNTVNTLYRHAEIAGNTATSITVWGKAEWVSANRNYRIYDYRLRQDSPAVNAGVAADAPVTDLDGNPRPAMGGIDIGAYEAQPPQGTTLLLY